MKKNFSKKILVVSAIAIFAVGGMVVQAMPTNTFVGGVTGLPGAGTTYANYSPIGKKVYVTAKGKATLTKYANSKQIASASVKRAITGNKANWGTR